MARKKKSLKAVHEHNTNTTNTTTTAATAATTATTDTNTTATTATTATVATEQIDGSMAEDHRSLSSTKRASFDEHLLQQEQQHQQLTELEQKTLQYQSDSELLDLKQKLHLEKNKSNLFLIKSYSFVDKTNAKRPTNLHVKKKLEQFDNFHTLMLDNGRDGGDKVSSNANDTNTKSPKNKQKQMDKKLDKREKLDKLEKLEKLEKSEKPKKPPKLSKMKKSKSTHDSTENLDELQQLLRKPSVILEDEIKTNGSDCSKRPQSMPLTQHNHKAMVKSKAVDDIETPRLKRDSFLRHSLQSIRRSFSSTKKYNSNQISFTSSSSSTSSTSSSSSSSSNSSAASDIQKKTKSKNSNKDIGNLKDVEDEKYLITEVDEQQKDGEKVFAHGETVASYQRPCNVIITLNDVGKLEKQYSVDGTSVSLSTVTHAMDSLTVLKEEDEKDAYSRVNTNSSSDDNTTSHPSCKRSTSSVSTLAQLPTDSLSPMAPLQTHTECQSVQCLNILDKDYNCSSSTTTTTSSSPPEQQSKREFQHQLSIPESLQSTSIGCTTSSEYSSARSLKYSATSLTPLQTLNSSESLRSISPSRRSASSNSSSTAKHEQSTAAATAAAAATATTSNGSSSTTPPEKEKKLKEISSSRVKKFHRHFSQVSKDEKLINYFSCALVSDILLQGHLYITDQHFAFYSNVFGYVTKVVIPTSSVTKISKEKTAKIIPNAVGVATADERHVFGSFISREAAFRLMCSVCPPLGVPEILPKDPATIEISEEYSIEDDSSCSISGNESPAQTIELQNNSENGSMLHNDTSQTILRRSVGSSNLSIAENAADKLRHSDIPINAKNTTILASSRASAPPTTMAGRYVNGSSGGSDGAGGGIVGGVNLVGLKSVLQPAIGTSPEGGKLTIIAGCASSTTSATSTPTPSTSSSPTTVMNLPSSKANQVMNIFRSVSKKLMLHIKFPTEIHVVYLGVILTLLLALFSLFLLYRILDIEAKTNGYRSPIEFNWRSGNDDDILSEALRFQKQLQLKSTEEAQNIIKTNLEQIAKVRRSLETLSMLIHDRSSSFVSPNTDDSD